jgi:uncharacterized protein (TIGR02117 family)
VRILTVLLLLSLSAAPAAQAEVLIYVERDRLHTALVLPVETLGQHQPALAAFATPDHHWLRFGWGEAGYFGQDERTSGATLRALFWRSPSVMEVARLSGPRSTYRDSHALTVSLDQFQTLTRFIFDTFEQGDQALLPLRKATPDIHYYPARPRYHLFYNCNHWTAEALHRIGLRSGYRGAWLAGSVMSRLPAAAVGQE